MKQERKAGILMQPISLPSEYGIGTLGKKCFEFIDFLHEAKQKLWQIFPLGPTGFGDSPYQCFSAFAGNPYLIDLEKLVENGLLTYDDIQPMKTNDLVIDYGKLYNVKNPILMKAYDKKEILEKEFDKFKQENAEWLDNYALFIAVKNYFNGASWDIWPDNELRLAHKRAKDKYAKKLEKEVDVQKFIQFLFFKQWNDVKKYANSKGIEIIGDIPIFVSFDSADAWSNPEIFLFDKDRKPVCVAGVPPDYFSATGQLWGNPLYDWKKLKRTGYKWWKDRIKANLKLCDIIRIDHFRGFRAYWQIPYGEETAINGKWVEGPGIDLFKSIEEEYPNLKIIAEDLGNLEEEDIKLVEETGYPGMKILQFAFDDDPDNVYLPHNYTTTNCVVYTGTHDNDTTQGWYNSLNEYERGLVRDYTDSASDDGMCWRLIRLAHRSVAKYSIIPIQDYLCYGSDTRMNVPGVGSGNWQFKLREGVLTHELAVAIGHITEIYGR